MINLKSLVSENYEEQLASLRKERDALVDRLEKSNGDEYKSLANVWSAINKQITQLKSQIPHEVDKERFLQHHYTGYIQPGAYKAYEKEGGLAWLGSKSKYPKLLDKGQYGPYEVEFRQSGEKTRYVKHDAEGEIFRDAHGGAVEMTPDEIKAAGLPTESSSIIAFIGDKPIGFASNEFGAVGVWVEGPYQKLGIGTDLLTKHIEFRPDVRSGRNKIGQMTPAGKALTKKYYDKMATQHGKEWFKKMYPQLKESESDEVLNEYQEGHPLIFQNELRGSSHGQKDFTLWARDLLNKIVGRIDYSIFDEDIHILYIDVDPEERRKGVATLLAKKLQKLYPGIGIDWGMTTVSGSKFLKNLPKQFVPNEEYLKLIKELEALKEKENQLRKIQNGWHKLYNVDREKAEKLRPTMLNMGHQFNSISDRVWKIEQRLQILKSGKWLVNV